jgi:enamine deaminase RidA (YjgF/YER057c/UK114 family)
MSILDNLAEKGIVLPAAPKPLGIYQPAVKSGNMVFLSGILPLVDGKLPEEYTGKLGYNIYVDTGGKAAQQAILNAVSILHEYYGLDNVVQIVRMTGHFSCTPAFTEHPAALNPASEMLGRIFGDKGVHARLALGSVVLPLNSCVEIELIVEVK